MTFSTKVFCSTLAIALAAMVATTLPSQAKSPTDATSTVPVRMTVTATVENGKRMPAVYQDDVFVKKGSERLQVTDWVAARGEHAGLELFLLIDDASDPVLGTKLDELRAFINSQPSSTQIGLGYMKNATVQVVQNLTTDHALVAKALRLPLGYVGAYGNPYLSAVDLIKRWPASENRREIVMVTDGIDRARRSRNALLNPDVDTAAEVAQRAGIMIHTIYTPGVGHWHRNFWEANNGQNALSKLSDVTGGESFFLSLQNPVSFAPYVDQLSKIFDSQYLLTFSAQPSKKAGLQYVSVSTEAAGVDLNSADAVWVPAAK